MYEDLVEEALKKYRLNSENARKMAEYIVDRMSKEIDETVEAIEKLKRVERHTENFLSNLLYMALSGIVLEFAVYHPGTYESFILFILSIIAMSVFFVLTMDSLIKMYKQRKELGI